jgi:hypothetical protein
VGGGGEGESHPHPARIALDGRAQELLDPGEADDLVEAPAYLPTPHSQDRAHQEDVLPTGQLGVKAGAHVEQGADAATRARLTAARLCYSGEDLEQGGLPCPIRPDDSDRLSLRD